MKGEWIYIRKNGSNVAAFKRVERATITFELVCRRSNPEKDVVVMVTESGEILATL